MTIEYIILTIFLAINIMSFVVMLIDKQRAVRGNTNRISEGVMFFWSAVFGSLGIYVGMYVFKHKTRKWYFKIGLPLLFVQNIIVLYYLYLLKITI